MKKVNFDDLFCKTIGRSHEIKFLKFLVKPF